MANFTTSETELINQQARAPAARPYYYNAQRRTPVQITADFEGFLILQTADEKQKTLTWIGSAAKLEEDHKDRDDLLSKYLDLRVVDAQARIDEIGKRTNDFLEFKTNFITDGGDSSRFASIEEVNLLALSLQRPMDRMVVQQEAAYHELVLTNTLKNKLIIEQTTEDTQKELKSWQTVVSGYPGQAKKATAA
jgi:hypothetical protein